MVALAVSAGLLLSACDGGEDPTTPPTSSETSQDPTPSETTSEATPSTEGPTPPEVEAHTPPPEAAVDDHVGAIHAARYFLDLYAYMRQSGDTTQFQAMSAPECEFCSSSISNAAEIHDGDGWVEGGEFVVDVSQARADYPTADEPSYVVRFTVVEEPSVIHRGDGTLEEVEGGELRSAVALQYVQGRFLVVGVNAE